MALEQLVSKIGIPEAIGSCAGFVVGEAADHNMNAAAGWPEVENLSSGVAGAVAVGGLVYLVRSRLKNRH